MTDGLASIITSLEQQRAAIDKALSALREVDGGTTARVSESTGRKGRKRSAAVRKKMAEAQRRRYANLKAASEPAPVATTKRKISPEGRKRLAAAMKKRWAVKRAKATVKKAVKKAGKKKAAVAAADVVPF